MIKWPIGFDDFTVRQKFIDQKCEKQQREFPEINVFKDTMSNFYDGVIRFDKQGIVTIEAEKAVYILKETKKELGEVIMHHYEYPDNTNLRTAIFTQETQKKLASTLQSFGLELQEKYTIEEVEDPNTEIHYIHPMFSFSNIHQLNKFLQKIYILDNQLQDALRPIINQLGEKITNGFEGKRTNEELDIFHNIKEFNTHTKRFGLRENEIMDGWRNVFITLEKGCLAEYKESIKLGFYCHIEEGLSEAPLIYPPTFFEELFNAEYKNNETINLPNMCKTTLRNIEKNIQKCGNFLVKIKDKQIIFKRASKELVLGILEVIKIIKRIKNLETEEKEELIDQLDEYCIQIVDLNGGKVF